MPISNATVTAFEWGKRRRSWWCYRKIEEYWTAPRIGFENLPFVNPGETKSPIEFDPPKSPAPRNVVSYVPQVILTFQDGNGRKWVRWPTKGLSTYLGRPLVIHRSGWTVESMEAIMGEVLRAS